MSSAVGENISQQAQPLTLWASACSSVAGQSVTLVFVLPRAEQLSIMWLCRWKAPVSTLILFWILLLPIQLVIRVTTEDQRCSHAGQRVLDFYQHSSVLSVWFLIKNHCLSPQITLEQQENTLALDIFSQRSNCGALWGVSQCVRRLYPAKFLFSRQTDNPTRQMHKPDVPALRGESVWAPRSP